MNQQQHQNRPKKGKEMPKAVGKGERGYYTYCPTCRIQDDDCRFPFNDICKHREWCDAWLNAKTEAQKSSTGGDRKE